MEEFLPILLRCVPALIDIVKAALAGGSHPDEAAWCAHVPGLEDVCAAIRDKDSSTFAAVTRILCDIGTPQDPLRTALAKLAARQGARA